ncbi:MAG TPA: metalloregulator ArsR/SmtB family transcription factor [Coriobacteriia bacterium]
MDADFFCMHSELCKTLANDKRQMILGALRDGELSVTALSERTGIAQSNLSQHLATMRAHDVVLARREGSHIYYSIANPKLIQAFDLITEVMQESMDARARVADTSQA